MSFNCMKRILFLIILHVPPWVIVFFTILTFAIPFFLAPWIAAEKLLHSRNFKTIDGLECVELAQEETKVFFECRCNLHFHRLKFVFNSKNPPGEIERLSDFNGSFLQLINYNLRFNCTIYVVHFLLDWMAFFIKGLESIPKRL